MSVTRLVEFANSPDEVLAAAVEIAFTIGKVRKTDKISRTLVALVKKGVDLAWEPVSLHVKIEVLSDRSALLAEAIQNQTDGSPDQRNKGLDVFVSYVKRRKDLTILD